MRIYNFGFPIFLVGVVMDLERILFGKRHGDNRKDGSSLAAG
jgi:hypothetical protein